VVDRGVSHGLLPTPRESVEWESVEWESVDPDWVEGGERAMESVPGSDGSLGLGPVKSNGGLWG